MLFKGQGDDPYQTFGLGLTDIVDHLQLAGSRCPHCSQGMSVLPSSGKLSNVPQSGQKSNDPA